MSQNKMVTKSDLSDFYQAILPYLGGQVQTNWAQSDNTQIDFIKNKPLIDEWTSANVLVEGSTTTSFSNLDTSYAYKPYIECADGVIPPTLTSAYFSGTTYYVTFSAVTSSQAGQSGSSCKMKLRIIK